VAPESFDLGELSSTAMCANYRRYQREEA
jgi:hypothetical protein